MADIQYEDGGPDTSVPARAGLTGSIPAGSSSYSDSPLASVDPALKGGMHDLLGGKIKADEAAYGETNAISRSILNDQKRQYDATAVQPGEFPKWDADQQAAKYRTDPLSSFGSLGSVFGMIASAFTHHPMQNAMEASAAAMNAIHAGDQKAYDQAHEAWKQNLDMTFKRHELERQHFEDGFKMFEANMQLGANQLKQNAVKFGDQKAMFLIDHEMWPEYFEMMDSRAKTALALKETTDKLDQIGTTQAWRQRMMDNLPEDVKKDPVKLAGAKQFILQSSELINGKNIDQQALGNWQAKYLREHGEPPPDEAVIAKIRELNSAKWAGHGAQSADQQFISRFYEEHPNATSEEFTQAFGEFKRSQKNAPGASGTKPGSSAQVLEEVKADIAKEHPDWSPGQLDIEAQKRIAESKRVGASGEPLSDEQAKFMGQQLAAGDTSVLTNLGRGKQGAENVLKVRRAAMDEITAKGGTGADMAHRSAAYQGERAEQRAAGTLEGRVGPAAIAAAGAAKLALEASDKVPRGTFVPLNELMQKAQSALSNKELRSFQAANTTFVNEYTAATSKSGASTDAMRAHAYDMLRTADSQDAYKAVVDTMRKEMLAAVAAPVKFREYVEKGGNAAVLDSLGGPGSSSKDLGGGWSVKVN